MAGASVTTEASGNPAAGSSRASRTRSHPRAPSLGHAFRVRQCQREGSAASLWRHLGKPDVSVSARDGARWTGLDSTRPRPRCAWRRVSLSLFTSLEKRPSSQPWAGPSWGTQRTAHESKNTGSEGSQQPPAAARTGNRSLRILPQLRWNRVRLPARVSQGTGPFMPDGTCSRTSRSLLSLGH